MYKAVVVRFETNGGTPVSPMTIEYGFMIHVPDSTKMGYSFSGWCKDSELKVSFDPNKIIEENLTLYAKWENYAPKKFINDISVYTNLSNVVKDYQELYGSDIKETMNEEESGITNEKKREEKSNYIKELIKDFNSESIAYKQVSLELNKISIKAEKARLKMEKRVERRGKERCAKIISSYNDIASKEGEVQTKYQEVVNRLDTIESKYEEFASNNR